MAHGAVSGIGDNPSRAGVGDGGIVPVSGLGIGGIAPVSVGRPVSEVSGLGIGGIAPVSAVRPGVPESPVVVWPVSGSGMGGRMVVVVDVVVEDVSMGGAIGGMGLSAQPAANRATNGIGDRSFMVQLYPSPQESAGAAQRRSMEERRRGSPVLVDDEDGGSYESDQAKHGDVEHVPEQCVGVFVSNAICF